MQVKRLFGRCRIIGKRFPIVHVFANGSCLEVSSFGTHAKRELVPLDAAAFLPHLEKVTLAITHASPQSSALPSILRRSLATLLAA